MRAHTVILGAGATIAAIPNGDRNGKKSSVMSGLIKKLNLSDILSGIELHTQSDNLEDIYSELSSRLECKDIVCQLEKRLYDYFASLELPENPTVYDFLILSLTHKDAIATFNWDPLLIQAFIRCQQITDNLPYIYCLHGNVAMGYCSNQHGYGIPNKVCPYCGKPFSPTKLLYPIAQKDYESDEYINEVWRETENFIENSYMLTIFGYSAPSSDKKAVRLLKKAWGNLERRQFEEVSVIDIIEEEDILEKWDKFIYSHHHRCTSNFFESYLGMFPRRSCETVFTTFELNLTHDNRKGFHKGMSWDDIKTTLSSILAEEKNTPANGDYPLSYLLK